MLLVIQCCICDQICKKVSYPCIQFCDLCLWRSITSHISELLGWNFLSYMWSNRKVLLTNLIQSCTSTLVELHKIIRIGVYILTAAAEAVDHKHCREPILMTKQTCLHKHTRSRVANSGNNETSNEFCSFIIFHQNSQIQSQEWKISKFSWGMPPDLLATAC